LEVNLPTGRGAIKGVGTQFRRAKAAEGQPQSKTLARGSEALGRRSFWSAPVFSGAFGLMQAINRTHPPLRVPDALHPTAPFHGPVVLSNRSFAKASSFTPDLPSPWQEMWIDGQEAYSHWPRPV